jgi:hypothetical protein
MAVSERKVHNIKVLLERKLLSLVKIKDNSPKSMCTKSYLVAAIVPSKSPPPPHTHSRLFFGVCNCRVPQ